MADRTQQPSSSLRSDESGYDTDTSLGRRMSTRVRTARQVYSPEDFLAEAADRETPRSVSPSKRHAPKGGLKSGVDGLALLLMACELLDRNEQGVGVGSDAAANAMLESASRCISVPIPRFATKMVINTHRSPFADVDGADGIDDVDDVHIYGLAGTASAGSRSPTKKTAKAVSPRKTKSGSPRKSRGSKPMGPCTNPHCMNPNESPQWRRGPPEAPVLCNACGTRWIRNKSLVPIVPQRGIRYGKDGSSNRPGSPSRSPSRTGSRSSSPRKSMGSLETAGTMVPDTSATLAGTETTETFGTMTIDRSLSLNLSTDKSSKSVTGARVINLIASINNMLTTDQ